MIVLSSLELIYHLFKRVCELVAEDGTVLLKCQACKSVYYCGRECQVKDWKEHKTECKEIAKSKEKEAEYTNHPFTFSKETGSVTFNMTHFLSQRNIHKVGFWRTECDCCFVPNNPFTDDNTFALPEGQYPKDTPLSSPQHITNWKEYYQTREISLDSPVSILMSFPLTVYHIVVNLMQLTKDNPKKLLIHYLGAEKEICHLSMWKELLHLIPNVPEITIVMVSMEFEDNIPTLHTLQNGTRKLTIQLVRALYHAYNAPAKPDVIIGLNAGLAAYSTWAPTLQMIGKKKVNAFFTDYSEISCYHSLKLCEKAGLHTKYQTVVNPFRSPAHKPNPSVSMPTYSNGFIFGI
eukprot:TRINITY_DN2571_c0_g1_i2.p1 TRINITY_DN2571_c0_g1~~TRINITY_DN2571_c0_g1_i2.p1  ORF type:complete len:349 (-),score=61.29 TRINITY_DN2571_c0_g1_i2:62-1108(-)